MSPKGKPYTIRYIFHVTDQEPAELRLDLDPDTMELIHDPAQVEVEEWMELSFSQCPNCPLDPVEHPRCPVASSLKQPVSVFSSAYSHLEVRVEVETRERSYEVKTTLQKAIGALLGIYMVSSGCPVLDPLRPMVRYHLPVATLEETKYRVISMYLVAQYLRRRQGKEADWDLKNLIGVYDEIQKVNKAFVQRLQRAVAKDASLNAVVALNYFADFVPFAIDEGELDDLEGLFSAYLQN